MNALSTILSPCPRRLRVLEGPLEGTVHPIVDRFLIGRSPRSDLQFLSEDISREHAEIVAGPDGSYWLLDLHSRNGTLVDGKRIRRTMLTLDSIITIGENRFVFEEELPLVEDADETLVVSRRVAPNRCGTIELKVSEVESRSERDKASFDRSKGHPVAARYDNGTPYAGNVVEDVCLYRALELRMERNELCSTEDLDSLNTLTERLCLPEKRNAEGNVTGSRLYARLSCYLPATLRCASGTTCSVAIVDMGVDGAQISVYGSGVKRGELVWLTVDLLYGRRLQTSVLVGQVAWSDGSHVGLSFPCRRAWRDVRATRQRFKLFPSRRPMRSMSELVEAEAQLAS